MRRVLSILLLLAFAASAQSVDPRMAMLLDTGWRGLFDKSGVVAAYDFDDGAGTDLGDAGANLSNVGSVAFPAGRFGLAPFFDTPGQMLTNRIPSTNISGVAFWFNLTNTLSASIRAQYPLVLSISGEATYIGFGPTTAYISGELVMWMDANGGQNRSAVVADTGGNPSGLSAGWHHIVIGKQSAADATYSCWIDGAAVSVSHYSVGTTNLSASMLAVGDYPGNANPIDGQIDDLVLLSRPITHLEAMSLYWWRPE